MPNTVGGWSWIPRSQRLCPLRRSPCSAEGNARPECSALTHLRDTICSFVVGILSCGSFYGSVTCSS